MDSIHTQLCKLTQLFIGLLLFASPCFTTPVAAAILPSGFTESLVIGGIPNLTAMAIAPDGRIFICQQGGIIRVIKNGVLLPTPLLTVPVDGSGERGLLGIALDPDFATNHFVYVYYTAIAPAIHNRVSRFTASGDVAPPGTEQVLLDLNNLGASMNHNGGAIHFGPDGKLYIAVGENKVPANAQSVDTLLGKILRINPDGTLPIDNPLTFPGITGSPTGQNRAIWAVGLRNPFTFTFQPGTGRMFINDVGENTWEEINEGIAGSNYGWNICEGLCSPPNANFRDPLFRYAHGASTTTGCAITGGAFYNPTTVQFPAGYVGKYFYADFCGGWINRFDPMTGAVLNFATGINAPVDLVVTNDGSLYYVERGNGTVARIRFSSPTATSGTISGVIADGNGNPIEGAAVRITGTENRLAVTDISGNYRFDNVALAGSYTVRPTRVNFSFNPSERTFSAIGQQTEALFTGQSNGQANNPLDASEYFVRQQYIDFLGREPDEAGLNFWYGNIESCGPDVRCREAKRIDTSAAFFFSIEFRETGYLVHRIYQAAFGDRPGEPLPVTLAEFRPDSAAIGQAVVVNEGDWRTTLNNNKRLFAESFVQRTRFASLYPTTLSPSVFVDQLFTNAGVTPSGTERSAAIDEFGGAGNTSDIAARGRALRRVAENATLDRQEVNQALVEMQYFGYLRRDANSGPDTDFSGYLFWLNKLESFGGNYQQAELVKAFLLATEYRARFPR